MQEGLPIRIFIFAPFIALVLVMVGATAIVALRTADDDAAMLATRLHQAMSANIRLQLDDYLARSPPPTGVQREDTLDSLLRSQAVGTNGRAFILDMNRQDGRLVRFRRRSGGRERDCRSRAAHRSVGPVCSGDRVPVRSCHGEAALAGNVADLRDRVSRSTAPAMTGF